MNRVILSSSLCLMFAPLAMAQAIPGKEGKPAKDKSAQETSGIFHRLEVMRRVLVRSLADLDSGASERSAVRSDDMSRSLLREYYDAFGRIRGEADGESRVDYLPGYGAVISLTVSVPVRAAKGATSADEAPAKKDDGLWEKMESEIRGGGFSGYNYQGVDLFADKTETARFEFDPARIESLKSCLATTLARYGQRLDLGKQEWIGVSIRLLPIAANAQSAGSAEALLHGYRSDKAASGFLLNVVKAPRDQRLVFQIPAGELAKLKGTDSDTTDVLDKAEIDLMVTEMTMQMQVVDRTGSSGAR